MAHRLKTSDLCFAPPMFVFVTVLMCCIPQNSGRINVMHSQWINIGGYNWADFGLVFVTDWAGKK